MKHVYSSCILPPYVPPTTLCCSPGQDDERVSETMLVGSSSRVVMVGVSHRPQVNWSSSSSSSIKIYACNVDCFIMAGHHHYPATADRNPEEPGCQKLTSLSVDTSRKWVR